MNVCRKPVLKKKPKFKKKNHYFFWRVIEIDPCQKKKIFWMFWLKIRPRLFFFLEMVDLYTYLGKVPKIVKILGVRFRYIPNT